jgi:hypothetical protein
MTRMEAKDRAGLRRLAAVCAAVVLIAGSVAPTAAQGLADYDYDQLSFRGIGAWVGGNWPTRVESTTTFGMRADLGYAGPGVRIMPHVGYWSSTMNRGEVAQLETRVEELLQQQDPPVSADVDLGTIDWSDLVVGLDAHFVWAVPYDVLTYAGGGFSAHVTNGSGPGIDGTFVEDLIDSFSAGINVHGGLEYLATDRLRVFAEARYELQADLRYPELRAGMTFYLSEPATGEERGR